MKNIILDTDLYNEIDDQIALAYVLKSKDALNLEAVTIAPFTKGEYNTKTSIDKSYLREKADYCLSMCSKENIVNKIGVFSSKISSDYIIDLIYSFMFFIIPFPSFEVTSRIAPLIIASCGDT